MSTKLIKSRQVEKQAPLFLQKAASLYVAVTLFFFPLFMWHKYIEILTVKYYFYCVSTIIFLCVVLFYICVNKKQIVEWLEASGLKKMKVTDIGVLGFWVVSLLSTLFSEYKWESFWGNEGRFTGLFLITLYAAVYFCITRFGTLKTWHIEIFLLSSMFVCGLGITDYFRLDLLHFKEGIVEDQLSMFTSTIGNINTYTAYVAMVCAAASMLFCEEQKSKKKIFYYVCVIVSFFAIIMGASDNAYLALAALFGFMPLYLFRNKRGMLNYFIVIATFFTVVQCISWINIYMGEYVLKIDSAFNLIEKYGELLYVILILWCVTLGIYIANHMCKNKNTFWRAWPRYIWLAFLLVFLTAIIYIAYDCNVNGNAENYGGLSGYLVFNDNWGTNRGFIWRSAIEAFHEFSPLKKLIGFGPDTFGIILLDKVYANKHFDAAHNEYIQYLLTVGILGLFFYLLMLVSFVAESIRKTLKSPSIIVCAFVVICYAAQATVNLNVPISAPVMWLFLSLGMAGVKKSESL